MKRVRTFKLFANCIPVKGAKRSVICDLQKENVYFLTNDMYDLLTCQEGKTLEEIKSDYPDEYGEDIAKLFDDLVKNELGFYTDNPNQFPAMDLTWDFPGFISNAIVERDDLSKYDLHAALNQLNDLGCQFVEIRYYNAVTEECINNLNAQIGKTRFRSIVLVLQYCSWMEGFDFEMFLVKNQRIQKLLIHGSPAHANTGSSRVVFQTQPMRDNSGCGIVHCNYFAANVDAFSESKSYNSCLNRKVSISPDGAIRNCPSTRETFGNVLTSLIERAVKDAGFRKLWAITKDKIEVCRDCEFRYICTDCRAHTVEPDNIYSKPSKCNYDPYTANWL